jgi:poly-beta-hydroxyalkanoate depolymerase
MFDCPHTLTQHFRGQSAINISNIYCTDWSNARLGVSETRLRFQQFIDSIRTPTTVVGHDPDCEFIVRKIN